MRKSRRDMARKKVDLKRLPVRLQYIIALTVVAIVVTEAWMVGRDQAIPGWITNYLVPILGWSYVVLLVLAICYRFFKQKRRTDQK